MKVRSTKYGRLEYESTYGVQSTIVWSTRVRDKGFEKDLVGIAKPQAVLGAKVRDWRLGIFHVRKARYAGRKFSG